MYADPTWESCPVAGRLGSCHSSPIIVDTKGRGFHLSTAKNGVIFDINANGHPVRVAWPERGSGNAFLARGTPTSGKQLFGNHTDPDCDNGYCALAKFDTEKIGFIDKRYPVYYRPALDRRKPRRRCAT